MVGTTKRVKQVPINNPAEITKPISKRLTAPAPEAMRSGTTPNTMAAVVIKIGRRRIPAASSTAALLSRFFPVVGDWQNLQLKCHVY
ncbi:hypothetical protein Loa_01016 [Legionella oakridgensis ATCC 33761 = DSM 21215]|uniref:Uncharacterized protein n=1 Tax=Legionella oakridgensis ATCC 33761 = DSM 21215 TaxID=1268635 RepID=W0BD54_9GAMM|nr:hypothetical protein Loa_01016 [Legionella oakridgensis ATCC 33761 = DSM 21215]